MILLAEGGILTKLACETTDCLSYIISFLDILTVLYLSYCASFRVTKAVRIFGWVWAAITIVATITIVAIHTCLFTLVSALFTALVLMALFGVTFESIANQKKEETAGSAEAKATTPFVCPFVQNSCVMMARQPVAAMAAEQAPVAAKEEAVATMAESVPAEEPDMESEPEKEPETVAEPETAAETETAAEPEPVAEPETAAEPESAQEPEPEKEPEPAQEEVTVEAEEEVAVAAEQEGLTLKESLALAKATVNASAVVNKKYVAEYLQRTFENEVECKMRDNYTKTSLPLADTHYVKSEQGKTCFVYVYETDAAVVLLLRLTDAYAESVRQSGHRIIRSAFPKSKDAWYSIIVDSTYTEEDIQEILTDACNMAK